MSDLSQQFISRSYQSVINIGTVSGSSLTSTLQSLTDGFGRVTPLALSDTDVAINGTLSVTGSIIPYSTSSVSGAYDLGSPSKPWRHLYVSSGSVYLDGSRVMGLTNDTNNLHFIAPTGSQIQFGTNVFIQNPEVTLNPGIIFEATGEETGSSVYFNGGKGQIVSEGDLSLLLVTGDTVYNPSASIRFAVGNVPSGSINFFAKNNAQLNFDYQGNVGLSTETGSININSTTGSITIANQAYDGGLQIQPGFMELRQNDLAGGLVITSQSVAITADNAAGLLVDFKQGSIDIQAAGDLNLSSSLGTVNTWGTASIIGEMNVINGPLNISASSGLGTALQIYNGGIQSEGYIKTDDIFVGDGENLLGNSPALNLMANLDYSGSQYPIGTAYYDSGSYPTDIYAGWQVIDANTFQTAISIAGNSYTSQYPGQVVGSILGGAQYSGSDAAILLPFSNAIIDVIKPMSLRSTLDVTNIQSTGSINLWAEGGDVTITGSLGVTNIIGTGSLFLQPNQGDARYLEIYNTSPTDTHITASGGQIYLGNDVTYVKVDNYGTVKRIDVVADNGVYISSSLAVTGSLNVSGSLLVNGGAVGAPFPYVGTATITGALVVSSSIFGIGAIQSSDIDMGPQYYAPTVFQGVGQSAVAYDQFVNDGNYDALHIESQLNNGTLFQDYNNDSGLSTWLHVPTNPTTEPAPIFTRGLVITGSLSVATGSAFPEATGSALVTWDAATGQVAHAPYSSALPALMKAGAAYNTGSISSISANVSGSFNYTTSVNVSDSITFTSGSHININKSGVYNIQFSIQAVQGSGAADVAVWLKKNGSNVADSASYITIASNHKQLIALNLWDVATAGDYYQIAYQSDSGNTSFEAIAASGNIPRSPSIIVTVNQVR